MAHIIGFGVRGISKTIAVASEAIKSRKDKNQSSEARATDQVENQCQTNESADGGDNDSSDSASDSVDREWQLDRVAEHLALSSMLTNRSTSTNRHEHNSGNRDQSQIEPNFTCQRLPQPVILPQRRPGTRSRGFIRGYAPILSECCNITQDSFLTFLNDLDKASKASPIFDVINIACTGIGFVPSSICIAVSASGQVANGFAQEMQIRYRTNKFLDDSNEKFFKSRGLYCMIMTYRPDLPTDAILRANFNSDTGGSDQHGAALERILGREDSALKMRIARFRKSSGAVSDDLQIPTPAPLIYPALDRALEAAVMNNRSQIKTDSEQLRQEERVATQATESRNNSMLAKLSTLANMPAVQDYLDRRAQSEFSIKYPSSSLSSTMPPLQKQYANRFADPNHPVNSGSIFGLLSGGTFDPIANGRVRRAERKTYRKNETPLTEIERHDAYMGRQVRGRKTGAPSRTLPPVLAKVLKRDILYLVVVNMPSDEEVGQAIKFLNG